MRLLTSEAARENRQARIDQIRERHAEVTTPPPPPEPQEGMLAAGLAFAGFIFFLGFLAGYLIGPLLD